MSDLQAQLGPMSSAAKANEAASTVDGVALVMPNVDLTVNEARVIQWLKKVGEAVRKDEPVVEVETDKAVMNVESPVDGTLAEIAAPPETVVLLGQRLGTIRPS